MDDACRTPDCEGRIDVTGSGELRGTVKYGGHCPVCDGQFRRVGEAGEWAFEKQEYHCLSAGCGAPIELDIIRGHNSETACEECSTVHTRTEGGVITAIRDC